MANEKIDPVDVVLLVVVFGFVSFPINLFLGFLPFGKSAGYLIAGLAASLLVGMMRKTKRPCLQSAHERMRLARCAAVSILLVSLAACALEATGDLDTHAHFSPPLIGAPLLEDAKTLWIVTAIGVPLEAFLLFYALRLGLKLGISGPLQGSNAAPPTSAGTVVAAPSIVPSPVALVPASLKTMGGVLTVLLVASSLSSVADVFHGLSLLPLFSQTTTSVGDLLTKMGGDVWGWLSLAESVVMMATGALFLIWLHQAYKNLYALGVKGMASTPGWAVGWWFVPVLNLFKPCKTMNQLWKASDPAVSIQDPDSWKSAPSTALIPFWWIFWLVSVFQINLTGTAVNTQNLKMATQFSLGTQTAHVLAGAFLIFIVRTITRRQQDLLNRTVGS